MWVVRHDAWPVHFAPIADVIPESEEGATTSEALAQEFAEGFEGSGEEGEQQGPYGLMYGQPYNVLEARAVNDNIRLVRLHCPWPSGIWTGPWATVSAAPRRCTVSVAAGMAVAQAG